jgi:Tfp pilus assembly protein PilN
MSWYTNIWRPRKMAILFLHFNSGAVRFSVLKIGVNKAQELKTFDSLSELLKGTGNNIGYHVHVSGSGILSRKVEFLPAFREQLIISGNPKEFIFTTFNDGSEVATSFFRKALIQEHLDQMLENKTHLLGISSGAVPVFTILEDEVVEMDYKLEVKNGKMGTFERASESKEKVIWRHDFYSPQELISKAILNNYRSKVPSEVYEDHSLEPAKENYRQFVQFKVYGASSLLAIFLSLFANYFYQNHLNNDIAELEQNLMSSNDNLALLERLDQEKTRKEQLISGSGVTSSLFLSYYLDEIGQTVPKEIQLQEMKLFPLDGKIKNKQKVEVKQEQIIIEGTTLGNETLDNWIEEMDRFEWVRSVELLNYHEGENNRAEFKLLINQAN